jgi:hypothetical protein
MMGFLAYDTGKRVGWCNAVTLRLSRIHWLMGPGPDRSEKLGANKYMITKDVDYCLSTDGGIETLRVASRAMLNI